MEENLDGAVVGSVCAEVVGLDTLVASCQPRAPCQADGTGAYRPMVTADCRAREHAVEVGAGCSQLLVVLTDGQAGMLERMSLCLLRMK